MKIDWFKIVVIGCLSFTLMACNPVINSNVSNTSMPLPVQGESTDMVPTLSTPAASGMEFVIVKAKEDLAQRLSIPAAQIKLVDANAVTWPDASLGCPEPGMAYAQVLTPGYLILLEASDKIFEYHASKGTYVVHCENPTPPVPGTPENI